MGVVYAAEHELIGRKAAIKLLLPELSSNKQVVDRFFNEARAATLIKHPGVVDIFDFGYTEEGNAYIIMEFLEGESLSDRIAPGPLPDSEVIRITRQVASTVGAVHATEIIHRDLKPDNIHLVPDSEVAGGERTKVLDFGIAKLASHQTSGASKTQTGQVMGSPLYMSPEQCRGAGAVDGRADIYSLGCIMYEMACGQPVFDGEGVGEVIAKQIYEEPVAPRAQCGEISTELEGIILKALAKDPEARYGTMGELVAALDATSELRRVTGGGTQLVADEEASTDGGPAPAPTGGGAEREPTATTGSREPSRPAVTTLGQAATQLTDPDGYSVPGPKPRRWPLVAGVIGLLAIGGAAFGLSRGFTTGDTPVTAASEAPATPTATVELTAEPTAAPASSTQAAAEQVMVEIDSEPSGAEIFRVSDGVRLGETPFERRFDRDDGKLAVILKLAGHRDEKLVVPLGRDHQSRSKLTKLVGAVPQPATPKPPTPPTATAKPPSPKPQPTKEREWGGHVDPLDG
jgi:serine/threonine protein kinase